MDFFVVVVVVAWFLVFLGLRMIQIVAKRMLRVGIGWKR